MMKPNLQQMNPAAEAENGAPPAALSAPLAFYWGTALAVLVLDWISKWIVVHTMAPMQSIPLVGDYLRFTFLRNPGAAFSFLANAHMSWRFFLIGVAAVTMVILTVLAVRERKAGWPLLMGMGLVCGGAAGNVWDRATVGTVVDFIEVGLGPHRFPVFNLADSAVCIGVGWLMLQNLRTAPEPAGENRHAS